MRVTAPPGGMRQIALGHVDRANALHAVLAASTTYGSSDAVMLAAANAEIRRAAMAVSTLSSGARARGGRLSIGPIPNTLSNRIERAGLMITALERMLIAPGIFESLTTEEVIALTNASRTSSIDSTVNRTATTTTSRCSSVQCSGQSACDLDTESLETEDIQHWASEGDWSSDGNWRYTRERSEPTE